MNNLEIQNLNLMKERENFIKYLDVSELTLNTYKNGISSFLEYLNSNDIKKPTRDDFRDFREYLKGNRSINTINGYMTAIRCFFKYLEANGIYNNITKEVKSLKYSTTPTTQVLSEKQCQEIYKNLTDKREKCLWSLAITTGLRANEIALAKIENIKIYNGETVLFVKCKKRDDESEYVKLSTQVLKDIKDYIGDRSQGNIFISNSNHNKGNGVTNKTIRLIVKNILKRNGIEQDWVSVHTLRRTMATISYNNGQDIVAIQQVLHQHSIATTRRYLNQTTRDNNKLEYSVSNILLGGD